MGFFPYCRSARDQRQRPSYLLDRNSRSDPLTRYKKSGGARSRRRRRKVQLRVYPRSPPLALHGEGRPVVGRLPPLLLPHLDLRGA
jgi:hypothetical protein